LLQEKNLVSRNCPQAEQDYLNTDSAAVLVEVLEKTRQGEAIDVPVEQGTEGIQQGYRR